MVTKPLSGHENVPKSRALLSAGRQSTEVSLNTKMLVLVQAVSHKLMEAGGAQERSTAILCSSPNTCS